MAKEFEEVEVDERHPIRFLIKFALVVGLLYGAGRFLAQKKDEFAGLTETQARSKLMEKMGPRVGEDTAAEIARPCRSTEWARPERPPLDRPT